MSISTKISLIKIMRDHLDALHVETARVASGDDERLGWRVDKNHWLTEGGKLVRITSTWTDHVAQGLDTINADGVRLLVMIRSAERVAETADLETLSIGDLADMLAALHQRHASKG